MFIKSQNTENKINLNKYSRPPGLREIIFHYGPNPFQIHGSTSIAINGAGNPEP